MKIAYFPNAVARNGVSVLASFIDSCRDLNLTVSANDSQADVAVIWSQLWAGRMASNQAVWKQFRSTGRPVITLEVGALERARTWRVFLNDSPHLVTQPQNHERRRQLGIQTQPWRDCGDHIVVALQHGASGRWPAHLTVAQWCHDTIQQVRQHTDRAIYVRHHPRYRVRIGYAGIREVAPKPIPGTYDSFDMPHCLEQAWAVINYNSNPGIDSVLAGVPAFVDPSSLAAPVANTDIGLIESPRRPDREQWLNDLAWTEWTHTEIAQGLPLRLILDQCA